MKTIELFKPPPQSAPLSAGLLLLRLVVGTAFVLHGSGKIQNPFGWMGEHASIPGVFQALAAISEFGGGMAWILGLVTPLASFGIACTMTVAVWTHAVVMHNSFVPKGPGGSYELPAVYFCLAILFLLAGPGRFSLDRVIFGERSSRLRMPVTR